MTSTLTLADVQTRWGVTHEDHLDLEAEIPTVQVRAAQGDVLIRRVAADVKGVPVPAEGIPVVRGENGGNTHALVGQGLWAAHEPEDDEDLVLGIVTVRESAVLLAHPEHGFLLLAPGSFELRRQREQRDVIERVID